MAQLMRSRLVLAGRALKYDAILHCRWILFALLQAPGFGDGETFTDNTFTGVSRAERSYNIELEEMEVFAVSGYP